MRDDEIPDGLIVYFRQHNRRATWLAIGCLFAAIAGWIIIYGVVIWAELLFLTAIQGMDAPTTVAAFPHFLIIATILLVIGSVVRKWRTQDEKFHLGRAFFSLLSIPARLTYAVWDNLFARVYPSNKELGVAWEILNILRTEKKIAVTHLPARLTSGKHTGRIVYLLELTGLLDTDNYNDLFYHHLRNQEAERLVHRWSKSLELED